MNEVIKNQELEHWLVLPYDPEWQGFDSWWWWGGGYVYVIFKALAIGCCGKLPIFLKRKS